MQHAWLAGFASQRFVVGEAIVKLAVEETLACPLLP